jgi:hypothetical protein
MSITQEQRTAYHEAGHAVVGWLLGYRIVSVRLASKSNREYRGITKFGRCTEWHRNCVLDARQVCPKIEAALDIVVHLAGGQAEEMIVPYDGVNEVEGFAQHDIFEVTEILTTRIGCGQAGGELGGIERIMRPLVLICDRYVDMHRSQIDALAKALLADSRIVKAKDIRRILRRRTMPVRSVIFEVVAALEHAELEEQSSRW